VRAGTIASRDDVYVTSKLWLTDAHPGRVLPALHKTLQYVAMPTYLSTSTRSIY
jgi:diketogulonate reductase-like aldo/keto reductase